MFFSLGLSSGAIAQTSLQSIPAANTASQPLTNTISEIRVIGNRRIPKETILARMFSHVGDAYDGQTVERDFNSLWNTGYFENVQIDRENTPKGVILTVIVRERPTIREINYKGLSSVSQSDVLDRFKKQKVGLSVEGQYDATKIKLAETVLKEMLAEHGHQFATIHTVIKTIPPAAVSVNFNIKEGPTVKVGHIRFEGNHRVSGRVLRYSMKNLRPIGIPHSFILENLFARTYDESKLEEDSERVRQAYRDRGFFRASIGEPLTHIRNKGGISIPLIHSRKGKVIDITMPVEEGQQYRLGSITFTGNKRVTNVKALRALFKLKDGQVFNASLIGKGLENMRKAYGQLGYINFTAVPTPHIDEAKRTVSLNIDIDEGKPYYVSRIEFRGNTTTRDTVIRRELLLEEGQVYNSQLWETSILRLNQLGFFSPLKADQDSETQQDADNGTVKLLLHVKEKGKNSIGLNGGFSGLSGAFIGANYQTNNFLGLGESLTLQAALGDLQRNFTFGFTVPYVRNRPLNLGFQVFTQKSQYNAYKNPLSGGTDQNFSTAQQSFVQNYNQGRSGFSVNASYPIPRTFKRIGATYTLSKSNIQAFSPATTNLFQFLNFRHGTTGQSALNGIITSQLSLSYSYSTVGNPYRPRTGQSLNVVLQGSGLGGNVSSITPLVEYKLFKPIQGLHFNPEGRNILAFRFQAAYIQGIAGLVASPFDRFNAGGENDVRGFDVRSITPYAFIPTRVLYNLVNPDGSLVPRDPTNPTLGPVQIPLPIYSIAPVGGDTQFTTNVEYRIPIAGPVDFSFYTDVGLDMALNHSQLQLNPQANSTLNGGLYGCPVLVNGTCQGGAPWPGGVPNRLGVIPGTNIQPRVSVGPQITAMLPIINAPVRLYFAFNPVRLHQDVNSQFIVTRSMFPAGEAGDFTYNEAKANYGSQYFLWEPRKTLRISVSTSF
ncbi:MAG TPA: outer membrane protein assembly factor BamA [Acidobacteriaceae bacterium]|nr:outer membrane protein assembly factor BamA [Acidobacteriaceae bacterium]